MILIGESTINLNEEELKREKTEEKHKSTQLCLCFMSYRITECVTI